MVWFQHAFDLIWIFQNETEAYNGNETEVVALKS